MRISDWSSDVCSSDLEHLAVEEDAVALLPARDHLGGQRVEVDALRRAVGRPVDLRIVGAHRRLEEGGAAAVERDVRVARRGDRKSVVAGKSVSVRVDIGGSRILKKKINHKNKN